MAAAEKKERTIRSETTKVFLVIFVILLTVGTFTVTSAFRGANAFKNMRGIYLHQFKSAEVMKQRALDIIAIYYVLASDQDQDLLMEQLQRYDGLIGSFDEALGNLKSSLTVKDPTPEHQKMLAGVEKTKTIFDGLNENCRRMTFALMEGKKEEGAKYFALVNEEIKVFKGQVDEIENIVSAQLEFEANRAQSLLSNTTWIGLFITIAAIFVTIGLIYYLMRFLSVSLLPISNLMHNMRQAVFSVDRSLNVISPVSRYSSEVFSEEIVGKNLNEVVYRDLDKESEAFANARTAMIAVFGEDDVQWMLMEDCLPPQVKRDDKILKLTYTPLWDKQNLLQSIMIVAEDVTEIERLREEALRKQGEIGIVQGLIDMDRGDIEPFLNDSRKSFADSRALATRIEEDVEARRLLFRILHTVKGNARMYGLNAISEEVHAAETTAVEMNSRLDAGEPVSAELKMKFLDALVRAEDVLAKHYKMANKLFGIQDHFTAQKEEALHRSLASLELAADLRESFSPKTVEGALSAGAGLASYFESAELSSSLGSLKDKWTAGDDERAKALAEAADHYVQLATRAKLYKPYPSDPAKWLPALHKIVELTERFERHASSSLEVGQWETFKNEAQSLLEFVDSEKLLFVRLQLNRLALLVDQPLNPETVDRMRSCLSALWKYMATVCSADAAFTLDDPHHGAVRSLLAQLTEERSDAESRLGSDPAPRLLVLSLLRALQRSGRSPATFFSLASRFLRMDSADHVVEAFIASPASQSCLHSMLAEYKKAAETASRVGASDSVFHPLQASPANELSALKDLVAGHMFSAQLRLDLLQVIESFAHASESDSADGSQQMITIPTNSFNQIKSIIHGMHAASEAQIKEAASRLKLTLSHALDYPVKSICRKMQPMVTELSKRLGKEVEFKVTGDDVALNRDVVYSVRDALVHLIRNSMDHGIETVDERRQNGKGEKALIEISLKRTSRGVDLVLRDDGRGINSHKVIEKAIAKGLLTAEAAERMSDEERLALIFVPNLSTKDEATDISGRGVGMDAVKATLEKLGGTITVSSRLGHGTEMKLFMPDHEGVVNGKNTENVQRAA